MSQYITDDETDSGIVEAVQELMAAVENLTTEDDEPVDNIFSEKQQRLLTETLYSSWTPPASAGDQTDAPANTADAAANTEQAPRRFLAAANVGIFSSPRQPPLVPDVFLSLDVAVHENWYDKNHRSYFIWEFGKAPGVAVEVVSNRKGGELSSKLRAYARIGVAYYVVYDPNAELSDVALQCFVLQAGEYLLLTDTHLPRVGLRLTVWHGAYEGKEAAWLRWQDANGELILTGAERAAKEAERAAREAARATREAERAAHEAERAGRLAAKLRELGVDPESV